MDTTDVLKSAAALGGALGVVVGALRFVFWLHGKALRISFDHGHLKESQATLSGSIDSIKEHVISIKGDLKMLDAKIASLATERMPFQSHSPISLTDWGKEMARGMEAEKAIAESWESLILPALKKDLAEKNPYDIQQYCMEKPAVYPERFFSPQAVDDIKMYAFKSGRSLFECLQVAGLIIRDKFLEHIGFDISEIDKHTPPALPRGTLPPEKQGEAGGGTP